MFVYRLGDSTSEPVQLPTKHLSLLLVSLSSISISSNSRICVVGVISIVRSTTFASTIVIRSIAETHAMPPGCLRSRRETEGFLDRGVRPKASFDRGARPNAMPPGCLRSMPSIAAWDAQAATASRAATKRIKTRKAKRSIRKSTNLSEP